MCSININVLSECLKSGGKEIRHIDEYANLIFEYSQSAYKSKDRKLVDVLQYYNVGQTPYVPSYCDIDLSCAQLRPWKYSDYMRSDVDTKKFIENMFRQSGSNFFIRSRNIMSSLLFLCKDDWDIVNDKCLTLLHSYLKYIRCDFCDENLQPISHGGSSYKIPARVTDEWDFCASKKIYIIINAIFWKYVLGCKSEIVRDLIDEFVAYIFNDPVKRCSDAKKHVFMLWSCFCSFGRHTCPKWSANDSGVVDSTYIDEISDDFWFRMNAEKVQESYNFFDDNGMPLHKLYYKKLIEEDESLTKYKNEMLWLQNPEYIMGYNYTDPNLTFKETQTKNIITEKNDLVDELSDKVKDIFSQFIHGAYSDSKDIYYGNDAIRLIINTMTTKSSGHKSFETKWVDKMGRILTHKGNSKREYFSAHPKMCLDSDNYKRCLTRDNPGSVGMRTVAGPKATRLIFVLPIEYYVHERVLIEPLYNYSINFRPNYGFNAAVGVPTIDHRQELEFMGSSDQLSYFLLSGDYKEYDTSAKWENVTKGEYEAGNVFDLLGSINNAPLNNWESRRQDWETMCDKIREAYYIMPDKTVLPFSQTHSGLFQTALRNSIVNECVFSLCRRNITKLHDMVKVGLERVLGDDLFALLVIPLMTGQYDLYVDVFRILSETSLRSNIVLHPDKTVLRRRLCEYLKVAILNGYIFQRLVAVQAFGKEDSSGAANQIENFIGLRSLFTTMAARGADRIKLWNLFLMLYIISGTVKVVRGPSAQFVPLPFMLLFTPIAMGGIGLPIFNGMITANCDIICGMYDDYILQELERASEVVSRPGNFRNEQARLCVAQHYPNKGILDGVLYEGITLELNTLLPSKIEEAIKADYYLKRNGINIKLTRYDHAPIARMEQMISSSKSLRMHDFDDRALFFRQNIDKKTLRDKNTSNNGKKSTRVSFINNVQKRKFNRFNSKFIKTFDIWKYIEVELLPEYLEPKYISVYLNQDEHLSLITRVFGHPSSNRTEMRDLITSFRIILAKSGVPSVITPESLLDMLSKPGVCDNMMNFLAVLRYVGMDQNQAQDMWQKFSSLYNRHALDMMFHGLSRNDDILREANICVHELKKLIDIDTIAPPSIENYLLLLGLMVSYIFSFDGFLQRVKIHLDPSLPLIRTIKNTLYV